MDSNAFISEEVKKSLIAICRNSSDNKVIPALMPFANQKSVNLKKNLIICFDAIVEKNQ